MTDRKLSEGQRAYEARRAAKAGMSLEKWLHHRAREAEAAERRAREAEAAAIRKPERPPGFWRRLLDRAHAPLTPTESKPGPRSRR